MFQELSIFPTNHTHTLLFVCGSWSTVYPPNKVSVSQNIGRTFIILLIYFVAFLLFVPNHVKEVSSIVWTDIIDLIDRNLQLFSWIGKLFQHLVDRLVILFLLIIDLLDHWVLYKLVHHLWFLFFYFLRFIYSFQKALELRIQYFTLFIFLLVFSAIEQLEQLLDFERMLFVILFIQFDSFIEETYYSIICLIDRE